MRKAGYPCFFLKERKESGGEREKQIETERKKVREKESKVDIYIYIYIYRERERELPREKERERERERERALSISDLGLIYPRPCALSKFNVVCFLFPCPISPHGKLGKLLTP